MRKELRCSSCLIDGEAVACNENGLAVFERLRHKRSGEHVFLYAFDLLELDGHDLRREPLGGADLGGADLQAAILIDTDFSGADLTGCRIYGVSAWSQKLEGAKQQNLVITGHDEPAITVDNIEVAQFIYLLLHNKKIRDVIETQGGADPRSLHR